LVVKIPLENVCLLATLSGQDRVTGLVDLEVKGRSQTRDR
jgi:hypothetical protein